MEIERKREKEVQTVEIDRGKHTQEMLAPAVRLNCLIIVTGCSTRNNTAIAAVITKTTVTTPSTTALPLGWRWMVHHKIGNLWSFIPKDILTEGLQLRTNSQHNYKGCRTNSKSYEGENLTMGF